MVLVGGSRAPESRIPISMSRCPDSRLIPSYGRPRRRRVYSLYILTISDSNKFPAAGVEGIKCLELNSRPKSPQIPNPLSLMYIVCLFVCVCACRATCGRALEWALGAGVRCVLAFVCVSACASVPTHSCCFGMPVDYACSQKSSPSEQSSMNDMFRAS